jgi:hypothetical protein
MGLLGDALRRPVPGDPVIDSASVASIPLYYGLQRNRTSFVLRFTITARGEPSRVLYQPVWLSIRAKAQLRKLFDTSKRG